MLYLLDANTLIRANADYYPIERIPRFWDWLIECGNAGRVKIPNEIADEVTAGRDDVADWLKGEDAKAALRLGERVDVASLRHVVADGYAHDLDATEMQKIGKTRSSSPMPSARRIAPLSRRSYPSPQNNVPIGRCLMCAMPVG